MKTAYATIKGIEVMRALRKGQASSFYYGQPQGEVCLINRVFGLLALFKGNFIDSNLYLQQCRFYIFPVFIQIPKIE